MRLDNGFIFDRPPSYVAVLVCPIKLQDRHPSSAVPACVWTHFSPLLSAEALRVSPSQKTMTSMISACGAFITQVTRLFCVPPRKFFFVDFPANVYFHRNNLMPEYDHRG